MRVPVAVTGRGRRDGDAWVLSAKDGASVPFVLRATDGFRDAQARWIGGSAEVNDLALRVRFLDPAFLGTSWMIGGTLLYNDARAHAEPRLSKPLR